MVQQSQKKQGTRQARCTYSMLTPKAFSEQGKGQAGQGEKWRFVHPLLLWSQVSAASLLGTWLMSSWPKETSSSENTLPR